MPGCRRMLGTTEKYAADVTFIAGERTPGSAHWQEVQDLCAERLDDLGYEVERHAYGTGVNVIGVKAWDQHPPMSKSSSRGTTTRTQGRAGADDR